MRMVSLLIWIQPPAVLQAAGVGGGGVGVGVGGGELAPAVVSSGAVGGAGSQSASTEAKSMKPGSSKPTGTVWIAGMVAGVGGVVGLGHCACAATAKISSRVTTATLEIFVTCSYTLIVKLLPSICYFPLVYCSVVKS